MRFRTRVDLHGRTATGMRVPPDVVEALGHGKKPPVRVTIGGYAYRTTIASRGDAFLIPLSGEHRAGAGVAAGDEVSVDIELDTAPRTVDVPPALATALDAAPAARRAFAALSYSRQLRLALPVAEARTDETRERRVEKVIQGLLDGDGPP